MASHSLARAELSCSPRCRRARPRHTVAIRQRRRGADDETATDAGSLRRSRWPAADEVETTATIRAARTARRTAAASGRIAFKGQPEGDLSTAALFTVGADGKGRAAGDRRGAGRGRTAGRTGRRTARGSCSSAPASRSRSTPSGPTARACGRVTPGVLGPRPRTSRPSARTASYPSLPSGRQAGRLYALDGHDPDDSPAERRGSSTPTSSMRQGRRVRTCGCCSAPGRTRPSTREPASRPTAPRLLYVRTNSPLSEPAGGRAIFVADADGRHRAADHPVVVRRRRRPDVVARRQADPLPLAPRRRAAVPAPPRPAGRRRPAADHARRGRARSSCPSSFSPDGHSITFAMTGEGGEPDVFVMRADGKDDPPGHDDARCGRACPTGACPTRVGRAMRRALALVLAAAALAGCGGGTKAGGSGAPVTLRLGTHDLQGGSPGAGHIEELRPPGRRAVGRQAPDRARVASCRRRARLGPARGPARRGRRARHGADPVPCLGHRGRRRACERSTRRS